MLIITQFLEKTNKNFFEKFFASHSRFLRSDRTFFGCESFLHMLTVILAEVTSQKVEGHTFYQKFLFISHSTMLKNPSGSQIRMFLQVSIFEFGQLITLDFNFDKTFIQATHGHGWPNRGGCLKKQQSGEVKQSWRVIQYHI